MRAYFSPATFSGSPRGCFSRGAYTRKEEENDRGERTVLIFRATTSETGVVSQSLFRDLRIHRIIVICGTSRVQGIPRQMKMARRVLVTTPDYRYVPFLRPRVPVFEMRRGS